MTKRVFLAAAALFATVACNKDQPADAKSDPAAPAVAEVTAPTPGVVVTVDKAGATKVTQGPPGTIVVPSGSVRVTTDGKGNKVISDNKGNSAAIDDKGASAVTGAGGTKLTDSTGRSVVVGKDGKVTVPGVAVPAE